MKQRKSCWGLESWVHWGRIPVHAQNLHWGWKLQGPWCLNLWTRKGRLSPLQKILISKVWTIKSLQTRSREGKVQGKKTNESLIDSKSIVIIPHRYGYVCLIQPFVIPYPSFKLISYTHNFWFSGPVGLCLWQSWFSFWLLYTNSHLGEKSAFLKCNLITQVSIRGNKDLLMCIW